MNHHQTADFASTIASDLEDADDQAQLFHFARCLRSPWGIDKQCDQCGKPSCGVFRWGLYEVNGKTRVEPMNEARLCHVCSAKLWDTIRFSVQHGQMHYSNQPEKSQTPSTTPETT